MLSALYIAKTGLELQQNKQNVTAHNLANANTNGYKFQRVHNEDLSYQSIRQPGSVSSEQTLLPSGLQIGTGARLVATTRVHSQGNLNNTGTSTDIAINGQGFLRVKMPDNSDAFTRDGALQLNQHSVLVNSHGYPIEPEIKLPENATNLTIARDGTVSVNIYGDPQPQVIGQITLATFVNETGLDSIGENLYRETASSSDPNYGIVPGTNGVGVLHQGMLETSNVNVAEELINMIDTQRIFEINSKVISTTDQMLQRLAQV